MDFLAISSDGKKLISASSWDKTIRSWVINTSLEMQEVREHAGYASTMAFFNTGKKLVSGSYDTTLRVWDVGTGLELQKLEGHIGIVNTCSIFEEKMASGSEDKSIRIWDLKTYKEIHQLNGHRSGVTALIFLPNGKRLVSGSKDCTIRIWDLDKGQEIQEPKFNNTYKEGPINILTLIDDGKRLVSGSRNATICIWNIDTGQKLQQIERTLHQQLQSLTVILNERKVALAGGREGPVVQDQIISIVDFEGKDETRELIGHTDTIFGLAVFKNGKRLASASRDTTIRFWDLETRTQIFVLRHFIPLSSLAIFNDKILCAGDTSGGLWMWKLHLQANSIKPELLWTTHPGLSCDQAEISQAVGLSEANRQLMIQHGAK
ncbi:MAG: WD40 repeat domain-containing protein [Verrucomicrobia bacterium]|nr:WD40 repeat domain-containing protein [Verrucomicrobiota bacterium]